MQAVRGGALIVRSSSLIGSWVVDKGGQEPIDGGRYRWDFWVLGGGGETRGEWSFLPCLEGRRMQQPCEVSGGGAYGHYYM